MLELFRCYLLHLPAPIAFRLLLKLHGNYIVPRILARSKVRGFIASNYVSEFQVESFHE